MWRNWYSDTGCKEFQETTVSILKCVMQDDQSEKPYLVQSLDEKRWWYTRRALRAASVEVNYI
jgi:hypothetical protein